MKEKLKETQKYLKSNKFLEQTFQDNLKQRWNYEEFKEDEKYRCFCVFFDVKHFLKKMYSIILNKKDYRNDEEIKKIMKDCQEEAKKKQESWKLEAQKDVENSMLDYIE